MRRVYLLIPLAISLSSPLSMAEAQRGYEFELYDHDGIGDSKPLHLVPDV